jgi:hypothetical protein
MQVFYTSPWVPPEWIKAHGLEPRGIWGAGEPKPLPLTAGSCSFAEAAVRLAETNPDAAFVFSTHCDQLRRGFDAAVAGPAPARLFLFNLPATWQTPVAERIFASELDRLGRFLVGLGGRPPTAEALGETMSRYRLARTRLLGAAAHLPARQYCQALAQFHWDGTVNLPESRAVPEPAGKSDAIPLAVVGGPLPPWQGQVLDAIENAGGRVVLNATEAGERSLGAAVSPEQAPVAAGSLPELVRLQARSCLDHCVDVFQRPNTRLYAWLGERLAVRKARGIVLWHFVGCDLWSAEAQSLREAFGLPLLVLNASEAAGDGPRQVGRIQAFLESLR